MEEINAIILKYNLLRESKTSDVHEYQDIRDDLSLARFNFCFYTVPNFRAKKDEAEHERKLAYARAKIQNRSNTGKGKQFSSTAIADEQAILDIADYYKAERETTKAYMEVSAVCSTLDAIINSVASKLKTLGV